MTPQLTPVRIKAECQGETRWFDTLAEAQDWIAEQEDETDPCSCFDDDQQEIG